MKLSKKNEIYVGRGATAIYLILDSLMKNKEVILPGNICYAAIYPVIYSNNIPVFVDVNKKTGNMTYIQILKKINKNTGAIIFPYMYGNVSKDIIKIKKYCEKNDIILIEDCASAMGANIENYKAGEIGDYSIFSTGHAKTVDVGNGGILYTDKDAADILKHYVNTNKFSKKIAEKNVVFSKKYRELRNSKNEEKLYNFFHQNYKDLFIYKISKSTTKLMANRIKELDSVLKVRKSKYDLFLKELKINNKYYLLNYEKGSTPWRFTIIVKNKKDREELIDIILKKKLFVSDWYPNTGKYFSKVNLPNCDYMEKRILNFSLEDSKPNIIKICNIINKYFKES